MIPECERPLSYFIARDEEHCEELMRYQMRCISTDHKHPILRLYCLAHDLKVLAQENK